MAEEKARDVPKAAPAGQAPPERERKEPGNPMAVDLTRVAPEDLPPYVDEFGRMATSQDRRRARNRADRMGLNPKSGRHALYLLRHKGVDPLNREGGMLEIVNSESQPQAAGTALALMEDPAEGNMLDRPVQRPANPMEEAAAEREAAIAEIQRDLVRRRRRRLFALAFRLAVFVLLPTAVVGYYYVEIATPMYETQTEFLIQTADNPASSGGGLGNLLSGTGLATSQDSVVVQGYLGSREAFLRLNEDHGYTAHFQDPAIDQIQRIPADASVDDAYGYYQERVKISYDPTEGIIRMTVVAATPEMSQTFANALVNYAEDRIDGLTLDARGGQLDTARETFRQAEDDVIENELRVQDLQRERGVLSAEAEATSMMQLIGSLELRLEDERLQLAQLQANARPNQSQVDIAEGTIARLEARIGELRESMTISSADNVSLSQISSELRSAELRLATSQLMLQEAIAQLSAAQSEANRQVRFLSLGVAPVAPVEPTYPRKVESTIIAFFIFLGGYILASLTVSILREQMSV
ncbi:MAG: capsule biosynthesis protein [Pseudomonadota bacterium]